MTIEKKQKSIVVMLLELHFVPGGKDNPHIEHWKEHAHEIYIAKAKHLYHKIREQYDGRWWD